MSTGKEPMNVHLVGSIGLDNVEEVFRSVALAIDRWDPDPARGSFRGWLFRIARNLTVNSLVARSRRPSATGDTDIVALLEEQPAPEDSDSFIFGCSLATACCLGMWIWHSRFSGFWGSQMPST